MNERIREIESLAWEQVNRTNGLVRTEDFNQKFAELVVKECLRIVDENTYGPGDEYDYSYTNEKAAADDRANAIYADIKDRFGVK